MVKAQPSKSKFKTFLLGALILIIVLVAFVTGTSMGFDQALLSLTGCEEVPCEQLGIDNAESCEVCTHPSMEDVVLKYPCTGG